jgi:hypothetical protein
VGLAGRPPPGLFPGVSGLSRRQRSFPPPTIASVAGLRWSGPACHHWSLVLSNAWCQAATANCSSAVVLVPRLRSLSNSGRTIRLPVSASKPISPLSSSATSLASGCDSPARNRPPVSRWHADGSTGREHPARAPLRERPCKSDPRQYRTPRTP